MPIATHYCVPSGEYFCQNLSYCTSPTISQEVRPRYLGLFDGGYFKEPNRALDVSASSMRSHADCRSIGVVCQEARQCTLTRDFAVSRCVDGAWRCHARDARSRPGPERVCPCSCTQPRARAPRGGAVSDGRCGWLVGVASPWQQAVRYVLAVRGRRRAHFRSLYRFRGYGGVMMP